MLNKLINTANEDVNKYIGFISDDGMKSKKVVEEFFNNEHIKSDLVDIVDDEFYGLRATVKTNIRKNNGNFEKLIYKITKLDIKPKIIYIDEDRTDLIFQPNRPINIFMKKDYFNILMEFIEYIENNKCMDLHFIGWNFNHSEMITSDDTKTSNTTFTKGLYDSDEIKCKGIIEAIIRIS